MPGTESREAKKASYQPMQGEQERHAPEPATARPIEQNHHLDAYRREKCFMEEVSVGLNQAYLKSYGRVLHFNGRIGNIELSAGCVMGSGKR